MDDAHNDLAWSAMAVAVAMVLVALRDLLVVNRYFAVLVCLERVCGKAVSAAGYVEHHRKIHKTAPALRRQLAEYVRD